MQVCDLPPDEQEEYERVADRLDAKHSEFMAAGHPPRVTDRRIDLESLVATLPTMTSRA